MSDSGLILPVGRTMHIPGPTTTVKDLEDMAYNAQRGRAFKPKGLIYLVRPDGQTLIMQADGLHEMSEIQEHAQSLLESK